MTWRFAHLHIEDRDHVLSINPLGCIYYIRILHLQRPYFTIMTEYALNGRYKLSNWIMGCWVFFFRYIMQEILIIQKNNFIQFNYLMFSLTIIVVVSKVATYILQKSLISPKSRLLSRIGSRQTGVPYWFLFLRNISGDVIDMKRADRYVNNSLREEHVMFLKVLFCP